MPRRKLPIPTDGELAILKILWKLGGGTVRQVHEALAPDTGYTTTLKMLQIMTEKGLVTRDESQRSHRYQPAVAEGEMLGQVAQNMLRRVFDGSAQKLFMHALSNRKTAPEELARIRAMLDDIEKKGGRHDRD